MPILMVQKRRSRLKKQRDVSVRRELYLQLLDAIVVHRVADRPNRFEPRKRKRRIQDSRSNDETAMETEAADATGSYGYLSAIRLIDRSELESSHDEPVTLAKFRMTYVAEHLMTRSVITHPLG